MVEQLGLAIILVDEKFIKASGFTSGMTNGIFSWYLNCEVLSITIAPALAAIGANCSDTDAPAEKKAKSTPVKLKSTGVGMIKIHHTYNTTPVKFRFFTYYKYDEKESRAFREKANLNWMKFTIHVFHKYIGCRRIYT